MFYDYFKVQEVGRDNENNKIFGVVNTKFPHIGYPESWGNKTKAERFYAECILFVPYREYKRMKKTGYISAFKSR